MSAIDLAAPAAPDSRAIHPAWVRLTHWTNAAAMMVMVGSGLQIYNASPIFPFGFPSAVTIGGWLGGALMWHFAAMWVLIANGLVYLVLGLATGRFRRKLWPIRPADIVRDVVVALGGRLAHDDLSTYNAVQRALYTAVIMAGVVAVASGLAIWKPVQFQELTALFGGFQGARLLHFLAMSAISGFVVIHVVMALVVPRSLLAMLRGR